MCVCVCVCVCLCVCVCVCACVKERYMYMKVHVYSTPVVEWNKKRKEKKRKERQSIPTHPSVSTIQEYINIYRGDTWMPSLENWDGGLKSLLWLANSPHTCTHCYMHLIHMHTYMYMWCSSQHIYSSIFFSPSLFPNYRTKHSYSTNLVAN